MRTYNGKRILITLTLACLLVFGLVRVCNSSESSAQASVDQSKISYVSVLIHSSDTLSSIANEYYCDAFGSVQDYAEAIQEYNSLDSDLIYAGNHLMVPCISSQLIQRRLYHLHNETSIFFLAMRIKMYTVLIKPIRMFYSFF